MFMLSIRDSTSLIIPLPQDESEVYYRDLSILPINLTNIVGEDFILYFSVDNSTNRVILGLETPADWNGWFAVSMNYLMSSADMIIFEHTSTTTTAGFSPSTTEIPSLDVYEAQSSGYQKPSRKANQSIELLAHYTSKSLNKRLIYISCEFFSNNKNLLAIAHGPTPNMKFHGRRSHRYIIPMQTGSAIDVSDDVIVPNWIYKLHTSVLFYIWGFGVDIAIIVARYLKGWRHYQVVHAAMFITINATTFIIEILLLAMNQPRIQTIKDSDIYLHFIGSCVLLALIIAQGALGFKVKGLLNAKKAKSANCLQRIALQAAKLQKVHAIIGFTMYILGKSIVFTGKWSSAVLKSSKKSRTDIAQSSAILFTLLLVVFSVLEFLVRNKGYNFSILTVRLDSFIRSLFICSNFNNTSSQLKEERLQLLASLNSQESQYQINLAHPTMIYALLGDNVYDLSNYVHPGGQFFITPANGRELHRYLNGQQEMEMLIREPSSLKKLKHKHALASVEEDLQQYFIGRLDFKIPAVLVPRESSSQESETELTPYVTSHEKQQLNPLVKRAHQKSGRAEEDLIFDFHCVSADEKSQIVVFTSEQCRVRTISLNITSMGRHFTITDGLGKSRLYSAALSISASNQRYIEGVSVALQNSSEESSTASSPSWLQLQQIAKDIAKNQQVDDLEDELRLVIKKYPNKKALSRKIYESTLDLMNAPMFSIQGPSGRGLQLSEDFSGRICVITNGTGIVPFLDLLLFVLKRNLAVLAGETTKKNRIDIDIFCSFQKIEDFAGCELVKCLLRIEEKRRELTLHANKELAESLSEFSLSLRLSQVDDFETMFSSGLQVKRINKKFDKVMMQEIAVTSLDLAVKIYLTGSNQMLAEVLPFLTHPESPYFHKTLLL